MILSRRSVAYNAIWTVRIIWFYFKIELHIMLSQKHAFSWWFSNSRLNLQILGMFIYLHFLLIIFMIYGIKIFFFSTLRAGSSISHTLGKKRVLKIELPTRRIKKLCTIHVRKRDLRLVWCLHPSEARTIQHLYRNVLFHSYFCSIVILGLTSSSVPW